MKKVYIVTGYGYTPKKVYATREKAEEARENIQMNFGYMGSRITVSVEEVEFIEE